MWVWVLVNGILITPVDFSFIQSVQKMTSLNFFTVYIKGEGKFLTSITLEFI